MASASVQPSVKRQISLEHREPEKPLVYEPPDLHGRKHVEKITTEYRVREDGCLADRLQNEEYEIHFGKNKVDNKIRHMDLKTAKSIYLKEVEDSGVLTRDQLGKLCKDDEFIAQEIEKRINENKELESQSKAAVEMQDEEFAIYLQTKEKQKLEDERKARLQRHLERDRKAAERLQREFNLQAEREELVKKGVSDIELSSPRHKGNRDVQVENGTRPDQHLEAGGGEEAMAMKLAEQRQLEEERDRRIAIKLQRREAEVYQRAKREKQMRRAQTERQHDDDSSERRRQHVQAVDSNGKPIAITPPERRRIHHTPDSPISFKRRPDVIADKVPVTYSSSKPIDNNKKNLQTVDVIERTVYDPWSTPGNNKSVELTPEEGIYLTAIDAIGAVEAHTNSNNSRPRTCSEPKGNAHNYQKQSSLPSSRNDNRGIESANSDTRCRNTDDARFRSTDERVVHQPHIQGDTMHRNIAADIDPTYSTINHFSPQTNHVNTKREGEIRPAPVVQNIKRSSSIEAEKKKKKWFSKKEKSK